MAILIILGVFAVGMAVLGVSCCVMAGRADRLQERDEWTEAA